MLSSIIHLFKALYAYCTDFVINLANLTGLSYYEINFVIFLVLFPMALLLSVIFFFIQKRRLRQLKEKKQDEKKDEYKSNNKVTKTNQSTIESNLSKIKKVIFHYLHPLHAIAISIVLGFLSLFFSSYSILIILFICLLLSSSILLALFQGKWRLAFYSFLLQIGIFFGCYILAGFFWLLCPGRDIGNADFYSNEIYNQTNLTIPKELTLISKIDTIGYGGIEHEYEAECLYQGPKHVIEAFEDSLKVQPGISNNEGPIDLSKSVINLSQFKKKDIGSSYSMSKEGSYNIDIAFNKQKTKMYYSAFYY